MNKVKFISKVRKNKSEKGITLIALVVTVVVLLILSGVTISFVLSDGGILGKTKNTQNVVDEAEENEKAGIYDLNKQIDIVISKGTKLEAKPGQIAIGENKIYKGITIPEGFTVSKIPEEQDINKGLVIYDIPEDKVESVDWNGDTDNNKLLDVQEKYNQYVWVPVVSPSDYYTTESVIINQGGVNVTAKHYTKNKERNKPNTEEWREPGILTDANYADGNAIYRQTAFKKETTLPEMTQNLVNDYEKMIASLEKYNGFYIGRYELSNEGEKKGKISKCHSWYTAYAKCKELKGTHTNIETSMIFGLQWDATCKWLAKFGFTDANSSTWGNYKDSTEKAAVIEGGIKKYGSGQVTGLSESWKANNIYDLAGNHFEWTQEAQSNYNRAARGGDFGCKTSEIQVSYRFCNITVNATDLYSSRSTLYIPAI